MLMTNVLNKNELRTFLALRAARTVAAWPNVEDLTLFKRVPSSERYGTLIWGTKLSVADEDIADSQPAVEHLVEAFLRQIDQTSLHGDWGESGWRIVARLSRRQIEDIIMTRR
jgi:hypothetical protein